MGCREDIAAKIDKNTEIILAKMSEEVQNNKEKVLINKYLSNKYYRTTYSELPTYKIIIIIPESFELNNC